MSLTLQRRRSSWFGPSFSLQSFTFPSLSSGVSFHNHATIHNVKTTGLATPEIPTPRISTGIEPLFQDSYLSSDTFFTPLEEKSTPPTWAAYSEEHMVLDETLEELGLAMDDDNVNIMATFISIINVGKPKVVDISPPGSIRGPPSPKYLQPSILSEDRSSIHWRIPSYQSSTSTRTSTSTNSSIMGRTNSIDSSSSMSVSESPRTSEFSSAWLSTISEPTNSANPQTRLDTIPDRVRTLRRQSKNLSTLSKAFLDKLKDAPSTPTPPSPTLDAADMPVRTGATRKRPSNLAPSRLMRRKSTYDFTYQMQTEQGLVVKRKKSVENIVHWLQR